MSLSLWALIIGAVLIAMALSGTLLERLPLSPGILYLALAYAFGRAGAAVLLGAGAVSRDRWNLISRFGIRGVGSICCQRAPTGRQF